MRLSLRILLIGIPTNDIILMLIQILGIYEREEFNYVSIYR